MVELIVLFFFQAEAGIRDRNVTGVQTCALPSSVYSSSPANRFASEVRIGSRSASGPSSGSNRCRGTTSTIAPRRAPIAARSLVRSEERRGGKERRRCLERANETGRDRRGERTVE